MVKWLERLAKLALLPVLVWFAGLAAFAVIGIDGLFAGPNPVFVIARVTAYVTVVMVAAVTTAFVAAFGLACGAMLNWLGESLDPRQIVATMSRSFWCLAAYVWLGVASLILDPPVALTVFEMSEPDALEVRVAETTAFAWMGRLRYLALIGFLATSFWLLARRTRPLNALLAVSFGVAALAAVLTGLGLLSGPSLVP
ncbi:MAG: hypothetical protein OXU77_21435 [Gammaproteobacteria bacterium]|nr:hypothetical protein [Gammaproteobacteria bacterium]MDE0444259.1 hypothetical protein [Gammaproteobacteria bacterium]